LTRINPDVILTLPPKPENLCHQVGVFLCNGKDSIPKMITDFTGLDFDDVYLHPQISDVNSRRV